MNSTRWIFAVLLLATAGIGNAWADRGHHRPRFGITIGPYFGPWAYPQRYSPYYYPPTPYYYPPVIVERAAPPVYIEQHSPPPAVVQASPANYWYYCGAAQAYYPYVRECPGGWQRVSPQPPEE